MVGTAGLVAGPGGTAAGYDSVLRAADLLAGNPDLSAEFASDVALVAQRSGSAAAGTVGQLTAAVGSAPGASADIIAETLTGSTRLALATGASGGANVLETVEAVQAFGGNANDMSYAVQLTSQTAQLIRVRGGDAALAAVAVSNMYDAVGDVALTYTEGVPDGSPLPAAATDGSALPAVRAALRKASMMSLNLQPPPQSLPPGPSLPQVDTVVSDGPPQKTDPLGQAFTTLSQDLKGGASQAKVEQDAQQLARLAGQQGNTTLEKVALLIGSSFVDGKYSRNVGADLQSLQEAASAFDESTGMLPGFDPLAGNSNPLAQPYLQLEVDIANGADAQTIKADADKVASLAGAAGHGDLADAATNVSKSLSDGSYDATKSLTALMNANPWTSPSTTLTPPASVPSPAPPASAPPAPASQPSESDAYQKLLADIQSGADETTIVNDAAQLAIAAQGNGDAGLAYVARNIGDATAGGSSADLYLPALTGAAPGTQAAKGVPQGPFSQPDDLGNAYLKLENDVASGADPKTLEADAGQVRTLADQEGNSGLSNAANNIIKSLDPADGSYNQLASEVALMTNGVSGQDLGISPPSESDAYRKLLADIKSGADHGTLTDDVLALVPAAIENGDFGLSQDALDMGSALQGNTYDAKAATAALTGAAPGTAAAQQSPLSDPISAPAA